MRIFRVITFPLFLVTAFFVGMHAVDVPHVSEKAIPTYSSGMYKQSFYDAAYANADGTSVRGVTSLLVAHHLLVADKIAEVFKDAASADVRTVVVVSPNHFMRGIAAAQVSIGQWTTPYGTIMADADAVDALITAYPSLHHEEIAYSEEHGIYGLTPFVARSFPHAKIVPIILRDTLSADDAWALGEAVAHALPDAVLVVSVDMTHYHDADYTDANDARVLQLLDDAGMCGDAPCTENLDIDSNASMRVLFGFNTARGTQSWHMTHHGSSLAMGATKDWHENTSHILGYFTRGD